MTTERKRDASRRNGRRSRGPISANGKARASQNARTHGLCSRTTLVLANEDAESFEVFAASVREALEPVGGAEELLVDRIVAAQWRLKRVQRVELGLFEAHSYPVMVAVANEEIARVANDEHKIDPRARRTLAKVPDIPWWRNIKDPEGLTDAVIAVADLEERNQRGPAELARAFGEQILAFGLLSRYEAPLRRELNSALHELERRQRRRREEAIPVEPTVPADGVDPVAVTGPYEDPELRRAVERRIRARFTDPSPAAEQRGNSPADASAPIAVADFKILGDALAPIIGEPWPEDTDELGERLADLGRQVEDEGIFSPNEGRQSAVSPNVWTSEPFPDGAVDVIDVPQYIDADLIHALPDPEFWPYLGGVVESRTVRLTESPAPGHCWYVNQHVAGVGFRLRLWDQTYWPDAKNWTDTVASAFVSWWNDGVAAGWGRLSQLNEADVDGTPGLLFDVPDDVVARLRPTPVLEAWLACRFPSSVAAPPEVPPAEPLDDETDPSCANPMANDMPDIRRGVTPEASTGLPMGGTASSVEQSREGLPRESLDDETNPRCANPMAGSTADVTEGITPEEPSGLPLGGSASPQADGNEPNGASRIASDREESTAQNEPRPVATAPPARSYAAAALVEAMRRGEIQPMDALRALGQAAASYTSDDLAGIVTAAPFPEVKQEAIRLLAERDERKRPP